MQNNVILVGSVTKECSPLTTKYGIIFYEMTVSIRRPSGIEDVIPVVMTKKNANLVGDRVRVVGHIQTENYISDNTKHLKVYVYSDKITSTDEYDYNRCEVYGTVCKMKGLRRTPTGRTICDVVIATEGFYNSDYYIPAIAWGRRADLLSEVPVGTYISLIGRLQSRYYEKDDKTYSVVEFSIDDFGVINERT